MPKQHYLYQIRDMESNKFELLTHTIKYDYFEFKEKCERARIQVGQYSSIRDVAIWLQTWRDFIPVCSPDGLGLASEYQMVPGWICAGVKAPLE